MRPPPHDIKAERALLGAVLLDNLVLDEVALRPEDFYRTAHRLIWMAMTELHRREERVDVVSLSRFLDDRGELKAAGGLVGLASMTGEVFTATGAPTHAGIVRRCALKRAALHLTAEFMRDLRGEVEDVGRFVAQHEQALLGLLLDRDDSEPVLAGEVADEVLAHVAARIGRESYLRGLATGFIDYDKKTGGLRPETLNLLAAAPSMGKTALALCMALSVARQSRVFFASLEMSRLELVTRLMAQMTHLDLSHIHTGKLKSYQAEQLRKTAARLKTLPILIDDNPSLSVAQLRSKARRLALGDQGLGLVVVDYLQLMDPENDRDSRERQVARISRGLKKLAKELGIPVLALAQLSREVFKRKDKRPILSDLRESGALEQDADTVNFLYRDEYYHADTEARGVAELIIAKDRGGQTGTVLLRFFPEQTRFANLASEPSQVPSREAG